jgi:tRNA dimethylallyltransferase
MKYGTRQYAKRQIRWLRNKLLPAIYSANGAGGHAAALLPVYLLDATGEFTVLAHHISGGDILPAELGDQWTIRVLGEGERIMEGACSLFASRPH